jgi:hypothetical protein
LKTCKWEVAFSQGASSGKRSKKSRRPLKGRSALGGEGSRGPNQTCGRSLRSLGGIAGESTVADGDGLAVGGRVGLVGGRVLVGDAIGVGEDCVVEMGGGLQETSATLRIRIRIQRRMAFWDISDLLV